MLESLFSFFYKQTPTKVLSCEICWIFKNTYFEEHLQATPFKRSGSFLEMVCRSSCSVLTDDVMKDSFLPAVVQSWWALHGNLLKIALHYRYFSKNFTTSAEQRYWKKHLDGCFWGRISFGNIPERLLLKGSWKDIFVFAWNA